jgi:mannose-1-phosphate guanylyltransferase
MDHLYVCIMAGGSGERFWPLSRRALPKHLLKLFSDVSLLEETVRRVRLAVPLSNIYVLTNRDQLEPTRAAVPFLPADRILCEPARRDTAPACALGTAVALKRDPEAVVAMIASDHLIKNDAAFARNLQDAATLALEKDAFITFSVKPTWASPQLGYLELGKKLIRPGKTVFFELKRFIEKPSAARAATYIKSGKFGWNSGIFVWRANFFLSEARRQQPKLADFIKHFPSYDLTSYLETNFPKLPKISVDFAIMEKASCIIAAHADFEWDDVGYWQALDKHLAKDKQGNTVHGRTAVLNAKNNLIFSQKRLIVLNGVRDLIVVETDDAILVCHRREAATLKKLLPHLPEDVL